MQYNQEKADELVNQLAEEPCAGKFRPQIEPELCDGQASVDSHFICAICLFVVDTPVECNQCGKLLCAFCIQEWLKKDDSCP
jgi:hypothetical protein